MLPKKRPYYEQSAAAKSIRSQRTVETEDEKIAILQRQIEIHAIQRSQETDEVHKDRLHAQAVRQAADRRRETVEQHEARLEINAERNATHRQTETEDQHNLRLNAQRRIQSETRSRQTLHADLNLCAFRYNANYNYSLHPSVVIGKMDKVCIYCSALKFKNETPGMCCASGFVMGVGECYGIYMVGQRDH